MQGKIRLVIADDHPGVRSSLRTFLECCDDLEVVGEAGDAEETLTLVRSTSPDVVLLDWWMPKGGGQGVLEQLQQNGSRVQALVLTSCCLPETSAAARRHGAGFINKGVDPSSLAELIRQAVQSRR